MIKKILIFISLCLTLTSCSTKPERTEAKVVSNPLGISKSTYNVNDYYQVYRDGRIYVFDDFKVYQSFLELGEATFRLTRIGAGPKGETVVFGLRKADKKKPMLSGVVNMYDGKVSGIKEGFYAEVILDERVYIFGQWADLQAFLNAGKATYRYTDIAAGTKGVTLVYVLNKKNKRQKPVVLMNEYKKRHQ